MKITTFLIADEVTQDSSNHKTKIEGIFDAIDVASFPAVHKKLFAFTIFEGENKKYNYKVSLEYDSKEILSNESIIDKKVGWEHKIVTKFENIPFLNPGEYIIKIKVDNQIAQKKILVKKQ